MTTIKKKSLIFLAIALAVCLLAAHWQACPIGFGAGIGSKLQQPDPETDWLKKSRKTVPLPEKIFL